MTLTSNRFRLLAPIVALAVGLPRATSGARSSWILSHWEVNYLDFGFLRRGLLGTLVRPLPDAWIPLAAALLHLGAVALLAVLLDRWIERTRLAPAVESRVRLALLLSPLAFVNLGWDWGRFDPIVFAALLLAIDLARDRRWLAPSVGLVLAAMLTHEAVVVWGAPLFLAIVLRRYGAQVAAGAALPIALLAAVLWRFGGSALAAERYGMGAMVWERGIVQLHDRVDAATWAVVTLVLLSLLVGTIAVHHAAGLRLTALSVAPLTCLALFPMGIDWARWLSLTGLVCTATLLLQLAEEGDRAAGAREAAADTPDRTGGAGRAAAEWRLPHWSRPALLLLVLPLGPIGIAPVLPWIRYGIFWLRLNLS